MTRVLVLVFFLGAAISYREVKASANIFLSPEFFAQIKKTDTLILTREQAEASFLRENLLLVAERLNISQADALVMQARLWPNPYITIEEVNLWANERQFMGDQLPPLLGNRGRNQQVAVQIEQLILTAGKRRKFVALEQVSADISREYFEDLLRNLKIEFRNNLTRLQYFQLYTGTFSRQLASVQNLLRAYRNQLERGNIGKGEYVRLKALELQLLGEINNLRKETNEIQKELKVLMNLPPEAFLVLSAEGFVPASAKLDKVNYEEISALALENRPDLKISRLEESYFSKLYSYERAYRVPNLNLLGSYDRGGNFLMNFVGFGVGMELPVFNRNQGNIRVAQIGKKRSRVLVDEKTNRVLAEVNLAWQNLIISRGFFESIETNYESELDQLLESYSRNFRERNISMLEYIDFLEAYLENKKIILESGKDLNMSFEEIQFMIGKDIE